LGFMSDGLSVRDVSKEPPLHWPGKIWVVLSFIGAAGFIVGTIVEIIQGIEGDPDVTLVEIFKAFGLRFLNILIGVAAAVAMLIKRKVGWFFAVVSLGIISVYRPVGLIWQLSSGRVGAETRGQVLLFVISAFLMLAIPVAWLVYFIKARRRYLN
jgi:hypothetical protein